VDLEDSLPWNYRLEFTQDNQRRPLIQRETVHHGTNRLLNRPDTDDNVDASRLTQTSLEQVIANKGFRALQDFFSRVR
jgi:hypothetical protein